MTSTTQSQKAGDQSAKFNEIRNTLLNNSDKITRKRWYPNSRQDGQIWIKGKFGSDKIQITRVTQGTRRNPENYSEGEWTIELSMIKDHGYHDIRNIPMEEMEEDELDGLLYATHEDLMTNELKKKNLEHIVRIW
jgi:hypothetical protein